MQGYESFEYRGQNWTRYPAAPADEAFIMGVDLGQSQDPTAIVVLRHTRTPLEAWTVNNKARTITKYGSMIEAGNPDISNLMLLLDWKASPEINMPHGKKQLSICDRDAIREWIRQGAKNN